MINYGNFSTIKWTRWTQGAIDCYNRKCVCRNCHVKSLIADGCKMKAAVLYLVSKFGIPPKSETILPSLTEKENDVLIAILNGATTHKAIATVLGISKNAVSSRLTNIYKAAQEKGLTDKPRSGKDFLPILINWLKRNGETAKLTDEIKNQIIN